jgi:hypothetical protein
MAAFPQSRTPRRRRQYCDRHYDQCSGGSLSPHPLEPLLTELMELAVNLGSISLEDKNEFIKPAFSDSTVLV